MVQQKPEGSLIQNAGQYVFHRKRNSLLYRHHDIQHNDTQHKRLVCDTQHK